MSKSSIEWTEATWNPVTGCIKVSAGCKHCYAETMAKRLQAIGMSGYENGFEVSLLPDRLEQPLLRRRPTIYFVNSMSDLFHPQVTFKFIDRVFDVIAGTQRHVYQILTKRPERMRRYFLKRPVPPNVWLGVTVENKKHGVPRVAVLKEIAAGVRFLSAEPLLEDLGRLDLSGIHWVIVGGESGKQARPMQPDWANSIRKQCRAQDVAFFFKQWGAWGADGVRRSKKANGRRLAGKQWDEMPEVVVHAAKV